MDVEKIKVINDYLKEQLWMDFEICNMNCGKIEMFGFLDEAGVRGKYDFHNNEASRPHPIHDGL